jgi:hypothetical protein
MGFHLPFSETPWDEFQAPTGEWFYTLRAITYDGWLLWRHALPEEQMLWSALDAETFDAIQLLAKRIHALHQLLPDYRRLTDTPFTVSRWWDPNGTDDDYHRGDRMLCKIEGYTANDIVYEMPKRISTQLILRPLSKKWMEFSLPPVSPRPEP